MKVFLEKYGQNKITFWNKVQKIKIQNKNQKLLRRSRYNKIAIDLPDAVRRCT